MKRQLVAVFMFTSSFAFPLTGYCQEFDTNTVTTKNVSIAAAMADLLASASENIQVAVADRLFAKTLTEPATKRRIEDLLKRGGVDGVLVYKQIVSDRALPASYRLVNERAQIIGGGVSPINVYAQSQEVNQIRPMPPDGFFPDDQTSKYYWIVYDSKGESKVQITEIHAAFLEQDYRAKQLREVFIKEATVSDRERILRRISDILESDASVSAQAAQLRQIEQERLKLVSKLDAINRSLKQQLELARSASNLAVSLRVMSTILSTPEMILRVSEALGSESVEGLSDTSTSEEIISNVSNFYSKTQSHAVQLEQRRSEYQTQQGKLVREKIQVIERTSVPVYDIPAFNPSLDLRAP